MHFIVDLKSFISEMPHAKAANGAMNIYPQILALVITILG